MARLMSRREAYHSGDSPTACHPGMTLRPEGVNPAAATQIVPPRTLGDRCLPVGRGQ